MPGFGFSNAPGTGGGGGAVTSVFGRTGAVAATAGDYTVAQLAGLPVTIGQGGTGQVTQQAALDALAGAQTANQVLAGNGTHVTLRALAAADLPAGSTSAQGAVQFDSNPGDVQPLGVQALGASGLVIDAKHVHPDQLLWVPSDHGLIAWAFDPIGATAGFLAVSGTVYLIGVKLRYAKTITNVNVTISTAGATLTANENFGGLYNSAGTLLSATADQSSAWTSAGNKTIALTTQQVNLAAGLYWIALVANGTTPPTFARGSNFSATVNNFGLTAANSRYGTGGTGQTSLPASITPSGIVQTATAIWAALS